MVGREATVDRDELREQARDVFLAGVRAADPAEAVRRYLTVADGTLRVAEHAWRLDGFRRVRVVGAGKAAAVMAAAVVERLGDRVTDGLVVTKTGHAVTVPRVVVREAGHPVPDDAGLAAARELAAFLDGCGADDLVIAVWSGGGSALLPLPIDGITLADLRAVTEALLASGAPIHEVNIVRRHLSALGGGRAALRAAPAPIAALILSDVPDDEVAAIASGPTAPDWSTWAEVDRVLERRAVLVPTAVRAAIDAGRRAAIADTVKAGHPRLRQVRNIVVGSNRRAVEAAGERAQALGWTVEIGQIEGEAREVGADLAGLVGRLRRKADRPRTAVVAGGETTVTLAGPVGSGGRNQELALAAAIGLDGTDGVVLLAAGTDGTDGPTDAAGGVIDGGTCARARAAGLDPRRHLDGHDAGPLLAATGDRLVTGPTRTNVMDLVVLLVDSR